MEQKFKIRQSHQSYDMLRELGLIVAGSAKTVRETIKARQKELGFGHLISMLQIATQPAEQTEKSLRLFAAEVMPYLR